MRFRVPHTLVLLFGMCVLAWAMTHVLPQGRFERVKITDKHGNERDAVVDGSYTRLSEAEQVSLPPHFIFTAIPKGLEKAQDIIFFVFVIGGCFGVLRSTGAIDAAIGALLLLLGHRPNWLIAGSLLAFAVGSSTIGMAEEYVPFVPVLLLLCAGLRLDAMVAVAVICVGFGIGYGAAAFNPFTVIVAQKVSGLESLSGLGFRLAIFPVFFAVGLHHILRYASRVRNDASKSLIADIKDAELGEPQKALRFTWTHLAILIVTLACLGVLIYGIDQHEWYLAEMTALFFALTIVLGGIARIGPSEVAKKFCEGAAEMTTTALLIGVARTIEVILVDGAIIDTVVHGIAMPLREMGGYAAAVGMFFVQSLCNLFIPSGSGQAYVTMPIMAPLSDLVEVPRQTAVLAYQFGDGFTNMLIPTNAVLIGILTIAKVPYDRWLRFVFPLMIKFWIVGSIALVVAVAIGYS